MEGQGIFCTQRKVPGRSLLCSMAAEAAALSGLRAYTHVCMLNIRARIYTRAHAYMWARFDFRKHVRAPVFSFFHHVNVWIKNEIPFPRVFYRPTIFFRFPPYIQGSGEKGRSDAPLHPYTYAYRRARVYTYTRLYPYSCSHTYRVRIWFLESSLNTPFSFFW